MADFAHHQGFMPAGNDLHSATMSIADAKKMSMENSDCLGFCFAGPPGDPPEEAVVEVFFKSSAEWSPGEGKRIGRDVYIFLYWFDQKRVSQTAGQKGRRKRAG
jgi:hypothetical protein